MNSERTKYSPVICWKSVWGKDNTLNILEINKQSSNYQKSIDKKKARETWKQ